MNVVDVRGSRLDADVWDPTGATITALDEKWPPDEPGGKIYRDGDLFRDRTGGGTFPGIVRHAAGSPQRTKHYSRYAALTGGKEMEPSRKEGISDLDVRHFIYATFAGTSRPPTTLETADHFQISIAAVEDADDSRLQVEGSSGCVVVEAECDGRVHNAYADLLGSRSELV